MERSTRRTVWTAIAALGLTVIAGFSAAAVTLDQGASVADPAAVQYVDQYGNPVAAPGADTTVSAADASTSVVRDTDDDDDHGEDADQDDDHDHEEDED